jgi:hypothetical protein
LPTRSAGPAAANSPPWAKYGHRLRPETQYHEASPSTLPPEAIRVGSGFVVVGGRV